jgi:large subunit ribosomal protein L17
MRHRISGKQLSRNTSHRKALRRNMAASLFQHGTIRTTTVKAKELRPFVEKLITLARKNTLDARRRVIAILQDREMTDDKGEFQDKTVVQKLFDEVAPRYAKRPGGYTRIIRLSDRRIGDAGTQVLLQLVEETAAQTSESAAGSRRRRRAGKRQQQAQDAPVAEAPVQEAKGEAQAQEEPKKE